MDVFYQIPPVSDNEKYLEAIKKICIEQKVDFLLPMIDYEIDLLNVNREWFEQNKIVLSINISVVIKYLVPIIVLSAIGFVFVVTWFWIVSPRFFRNYWFERGMYIFGLSTGVMATGVILLRVTDPEFKSGVLEDFGFAWIFLSFMDMFLVSFSPLFVINGTGVVYSCVLLGISVVCLAICKKAFHMRI